MVNSYNIQKEDIHLQNKTDVNNRIDEHGNKGFLNYGDDDQMEIEGYVFDKMKHYITCACYVLSVGLLRLFFHWYPHLHLKAIYRRSGLKCAEKVLVIDKYKKFKTYFVKEVKTLKANEDDGCLSDNLLTFSYCDGTQKKLVEARIIRCKKITYIWDDETKRFKKLAGLDKGLSKTDLREFRGQTSQEQHLKRIIYGYNEINVPVQTIATLLVLEALTPFYIFQLFSLIVWLSEYYLYYTFAIIIMSVAGITTSIIQTRKNQKNLRGTVNIKDTVKVCRGTDIFEEISTTDLVPGDVILIPPAGCEVQCDAVLLNGNCVVNESMLTGESVPITKTPLPKSFNMFNIKDDVNHILFCGTRIIQTRAKGDENILAVVIRTGYLTTKGELVRSILYPPPADFKFEVDSYKFIGILSVIALAAVVYTIVSKSQRNINAWDILLKSLDVITIAVPPALPAAMTVGKLYALYRLKKRQIFCINSRVINVSGSVNCLCFDKTGTLTENELDLWGVVPVIKNEIKEPLFNTKSLSQDSHLLRGMATCHSLSIIDGNVGGDPLDMKMFEATEWIIDGLNTSTGTEFLVVTSPENQCNTQITIIKQFQFSSALQRMSVVTKGLDEPEFKVFCKGSPETIMSLSKSVPEKLVARISDFTSQGYRVIAIATKNIGEISLEELEGLNRTEIECELDFLGLIVLENKLKPQTTGVINTLKNAKIKVVMITGDNIKTALHIAKESVMADPDECIIEVIASEPTASEVPSINFNVIENSISKPMSDDYTCIDVDKKHNSKYCFAVTGNSWANVVEYFPELVPIIVSKGLVFARMSGIQKQQLIEEFKNLGYYVAMCGDGANDCGALKAAHVGISLSEAESSIASPFTAKEQNITCVPRVIKEGRAALITSFGVFKIMVCYSLTELASVIILYNIDANLSSPQFLFIDVFLILNFASFFGITKAYPTLSTVPPPSSLLAFVPIISMLSFMTLSIIMQELGNLWMQTYSWFRPFVFKENETFACFENYAIYSISIFQYIGMVIAFSKGKPYRQPLHTNRLFTLSLVITTIVCLYMTLFPHDWIASLMEMKIPPMEGRIAIVIISFISLLCSIIVEDFFVEFILARIIMNKCNGTNSKRKILHESFEGNVDWSKMNATGLCIKYDKQNGVANNGFVGSRDQLTVGC